MRLIRYPLSLGTALLAPLECDGVWKRTLKETMKSKPFLPSRTGTAPVETDPAPTVNGGGEPFPLGIW